MRNGHSMHLSLARKLKIMYNEKHTVGVEIWRETLKIAKNEKFTLQNLEYGKKTENHGK